MKQVFVANAAGNISMLTTARFWVSDEEMAVFKNADRGPILWKPGNHPECRG